jgi:lipopolysaccharide/colanic/teichoic acid biosynthesis glycosyltransferase
LLRKLGASLLILAEPDMLADEVASVRSEAEAAGIVTYVIPEPFLENEGSTEYVEMDGVLLAYNLPRREQRLYQAAKRDIDITFSALILLATSPVLAAAAIAIRLSSPGPVLFQQQRVGRNGRCFTMYKFRTMHSDCATYARSPICARDPRITTVGRWLRHTCIDELPQLLNVLRGEMSLVGPRPEMPFLVQQYEAIHLKRLSVLPGLTGLWQLSADRMSPIHKNISYDLYWIEDCVEGLLRLMASEYRAPLNLGTEELVTINQLVDVACDIAGKHLHKVHALDKPQGVRGRNSDNSRLRVVLGWEPQTPLATGLEITYRWIEQELERAGRLVPDLVYA